MNKELQFNKDARSSMLTGMEVLAKAVGSTLGPKGKCVIIDDAIDGKPLITKDGVTVAKSIQLKDKFQNNTLEEDYWDEFDLDELEELLEICN